ncbi:NinB/YbcN family protein [Halomonas koreensis]|uniref:NinB protein n=1 Tax=Halomonas koreensis TaxID=245385 RepID=A0ABU1G4T0_9GAMM|nr:hypothetical protein [Halomonas koreensis]MDR5867947.1 hypothetical protein [Halomonas koreensis]
MSTTIRLNGAFDLQRLTSAIREKGFPCNVKITGTRRSLPQNAMFHMWCEEIAGFFIGRGKTSFADGTAMDKDSVKRNLKRTFLGHEEVSDIDLRTGAVDKRYELRKTSELDSGEMHHFLTQVDSWATEFGIPLTHPFDSEYMELAREFGEAA